MSTKILDSIDIIRKQMQGQKLTKEELYKIVEDVVNNRLPDVAIAAFIVSQEIRPLSLDEVADLTMAMVETGKTTDFGPNTVDKHSIGGVPGNKVSLLIVPIIAASGLKIPKTSSRSITTIGTADTFETLAPVELRLEEVIDVVNKVNGCIVWGGSLDIAPADDIFIKKVEHVLRIDPVSQMLASILAKKVAMGSKYLVLDIPQGKGTKAPTYEDAIKLAQMFVELGTKLGMQIEVAITYGDQPVGHAVGPALEAKEALKTLEGTIVSSSLVEKSAGLAGILLEMTGKVPSGRGIDIAKQVLSSGKALKKIKEIIEAQGGNPNIKSDDIPVGNYSEVIESQNDGYVVSIDNKSIMAIVRAAGAPEDRGAGIVIHKKGGRYVKKGEPIMTIYSNSETRLDEALQLARTLQPILIEGMIRRRIKVSKVFPEHVE
ncbi:MAG: AMP phosphorylase [Candidatus Njordarchaeia archaeon]|nr:AMP phosphorylase [Candidatus Korarchaeota archaeon]